MEGLNDAIDAVGAIDITLNCDTNLFIDPLLLAESENANFAQCANDAYVKRFEQLIGLLVASNAEGDLAWRSAQLKLRFHEIPYTHLGYSAGTSGSGFGSTLTGNLARNAKQAIDIGVRDPDLFMVLALFEEGVGADRISDMAGGCLADRIACKRFPEKQETG